MCLAKWNHLFQNRSMFLVICNYLPPVTHHGQQELKLAWKYRLASYLAIALEAWSISYAYCISHKYTSVHFKLPLIRSLHRLVQWIYIATLGGNMENKNPCVLQSDCRILLASPIVLRKLNNTSSLCSYTQSKYIPFTNPRERAFITRGSTWIVEKEN